MSEAVAQLLARAMGLPAEDRRLMAEHLRDSVDREEVDPDPEFEAEIARRSDEAHAYPEQLLEWDQEYPKMLAELARRRAVRGVGDQP